VLTWQLNNAGQTTRKFIGIQWSATDDQQKYF